ncbi:hypothetical protein K470DRAFT_223108 [Piedraia hortae CBS 480.64]|uniref:Cytokinesis regulator n=1 Tax=Piedraia hortae CBS 480.64 TaxID=1314780 RepID=A0A6A7BS46_9PEZI|nr:hypothetical protein K470DRAFT_223108 [Piedraia hortae CBS 480.64]
MAEIENWDDDGDFHGEFQLFAGGSVGTTHGSISSRLSIRSDSVAGDDDWNVVLPPGQGSTQAVQAAKQAGIPLPTDVPSSALLGGTITRLNKKPSRQKITDGWDDDLEMPDSGLTLKRLPADAAADLTDALDAFDDELPSSGPAPAPAPPDDDEDDLRGLEIPDAVDFDAMLKKRRAAEAELSDLSHSPTIEQPATATNAHKKSRLNGEDDDYLDDLDLAGGDILDVRKTRINKNLKIKGTKPTRGATTLNFHERPVEKPVHQRSHLPRPISSSKPASRLEPVFETGAQPGRDRRQPASGGNQMLRSKRSMPAMSSRSNLPTYKPSGTFNPPLAAQRAMPLHLRRESDPSRTGAASPPQRSQSRLSTAYTPHTPSRNDRPRRDVAPAALVREAAAKKTVTRPSRRRNFGDGSELDMFDDLPTSLVKEQRYVKEPVARGPPRQGLRHTQSRSDMRDPKRALPDRMTTPAPRTPGKPPRRTEQNTPSYLRDTAASRIARETRLGNNQRPRSEGPLMPLSTNWKAQAPTQTTKEPASSPTAQRSSKPRRLPTLIPPSHPLSKVKGMVWNHSTQCWEGNENSLAHFDIPPPLDTPTPMSHNPATAFMERHGMPSPPKQSPALIAPMHTAHGVQVNGGMVFDPRQMKWLKLKEGRDFSGPISPSVTDGEDEEDAFAGIEDLKDEKLPIPGAAASMGGMASPISMNASGMGEVHEEFDLGPQFIRLQRDEELNWRRRCELWFPNSEERADDDRWRWAIRDMVGSSSGSNASVFS